MYVCTYNRSGTLDIYLLKNVYVAVLSTFLSKENLTERLQYVSNLIPKS